MAIDGGLRLLFADNIPRVHWCPIETWGTVAGMPDANGCIDSIEFWVEFKKTEAIAVTMRPLQVAWHLRRFRAGGRSFIAVRRQADAGPRRGKARDELWLYHGRQAREIADDGLAVTPLGMWVGGKSNWNWQEIGEWLKWPNR